MKKLLFVVVAGLMFAACNQPTQNTNVEPKETFSINTITVEDSVQFPAEAIEEWMSDDMAHYMAVVDVPVTENEVLLASINKWIASQLNVNYDGDLQDVAAMVEYDRKDFLCFETGSPDSYLEHFIMMLEDNDRFVTYGCETWEYNGGAHGNTYVEGATFSKATGERFDYTMFTNPEALRDVVKNAVKEQYFDVLLEDTDVTFEDAVVLEEDALFPLPEVGPWIQNDSIVFFYEDYEIAPHAFGLPACAIPAETLKAEMTEKGKAFFE
jgi:hypothetical protein